MDTILAKRNLAKQENSAQKAIDEKILRMTLTISTRESEFSIPVMPIRGDVDFHKLRPLNISSIITKEPGSITDVTSIPEGVKNVKFENQLLVDAPQLPKSIETLDLTGNYIEQIDLSLLRNLRVVRLDGNRLKTLSKKNLPASLEELYIDDNQISYLNLDNISKLRVLHCRNNKTMRIENIPASIVDLQVEGNPQIVLDYDFLPKTALHEENSRAKGTESEFVESMHDYFKLKTKYEEQEKDARSVAREKALTRGLGLKRAIKIANQVRPKCVNCKRPVGTSFNIREDRLNAYCGDTKEPCSLAIQIFKGRFETDDKFAESNEKSLLETKEQIIRQKMDVLFNYASEEETVAKFKDLIEDYNLFAFLHKTDLEIREDKRFNVHKRELIKGKQKLLNVIKDRMNAHMEEFELFENRDALHSAMDIYIREYMPEVNNLRLMKYGSMEMGFPGTNSDTPVRVLNQSAASIRQMETLHGEVPKVLKFVTGTKNTPVESSSPEEDGPDELEDNGEEEVVQFEQETQGS
jgi:hypothetical protein